MLFLNEIGALSKIREIFRRAEKAKIAVAFWGRGAVQALEIDRPDLEAEIICNLDSGACNPSEIGKLRELRPHIPVRSDPRLHGKLYWTPSGIVIGSSNASTNGLAVEDGLADWAEANIFSEDSKLIEATLAWFETRKETSYEIKDTHLRLAQQIWNGRVRSTSPGIRLAGDLGAAVRETPENPVWAKVKLAIYSEGLSSAGKKQIKVEQTAIPALKDFDAYEEWNDAINADDWLLDFCLKKSKVKFGGYLHVPNPMLVTKLLTYVQEEPSVVLPSFGTLELSAKDLNNLELAALSIA
ncbi:phospholipase D family protein, partial [Bradyrhizobium sp.]|uniref:phospholipase D family protein n=1 Tax=Bradyrhizobium sp. TaxID=376 RepID=UPI003C42E149